MLQGLMGRLAGWEGLRGRLVVVLEGWTGAGSAVRGRRAAGAGLGKRRQGLK